jgi:hypothetical protein
MARPPSGRGSASETMVMRLETGRPAFRMVSLISRQNSAGLKRTFGNIPLTLGRPSTPSPVPCMRSIASGLRGMGRAYIRAMQFLSKMESVPPELTRFRADD